MNAIILSIKPEYVQKIISGEKKYEYRRKLCKKEIDRIYIYCIQPVKKIIAEVEVTGRIEDDKELLWTKTRGASGIEKSFFDEYFAGLSKVCAYCLGEVTVFDEGKTLSKFGLKTAPQSYAYFCQND